MDISQQPEKDFTWRGNSFKNSFWTLPVALKLNNSMGCMAGTFFSAAKGQPIDSERRLLNVFPIAALREAPRTLKGSMTESILFPLQSPHSARLQSKRSSSLVRHHLPSYHLSLGFLAINKTLTPSRNCLTGYFIPSWTQSFLRSSQRQRVMNELWTH